MATVTVLTAERTLELLNATIASAIIDGSGDLIFTKTDGTTVNAGAVGTDPDLSGLRAQSNAAVTLPAANPESTLETITITDDGSDTSTWVNRLVYMWAPLSGTAHKTTYLNEYGEFRVIPAKSTTTAARIFTKNAPGDTRDANVPVFEVQDDPTTKTSMRGILPDGTATRKGIKMSDVLVLNSTDTVPAGTPTGTIICRT